jgi:precorrin-6A synthase
MTKLFLVGIGTGNPEHLTLQAIRTLKSVNLIMIPRKGPDKADLAELRRALVAEFVTDPTTRIAEFDVPQRDRTNPSYQNGVDLWHDAVAAVWSRTIKANLAVDGSVALLVWGDPALYDSTLRIASRLRPLPELEIVPGITSIQALTAAHTIPLNEIGAPFLVTTGRQLRDNGWPPTANTLVIMLDGDCAFQHLDPAGVSIWWGAYVGMAEEIAIAGPLAEVSSRILQVRADARKRHGWIMDIYILRRG